MSRSPWTLIVVAVGVVLALGCGGYSIKIEPPPTATEVVTEVAPAAPATPVPGVTAPRPSPKPSPAPVPAPAPAPRHGTGQIQVTTLAAVQAVVDGVPVPITEEQGYVVEVAAGAHTLEMYNLLGSIVASQSVDVPAGQRVRFSYKPKTLTAMSTVSTSPIPPPYVPPEPEPVLPGSVEITGLASYGDAVFVDGYGARYDARATSYVSSGLTPGLHDLRVEIDRAVVYSGAVEVRSGENHRCVATWDGFAWTLDCHWTRPSL